jgi:hypothetical protein
MTSTIRIKRSSVAGKIPNTSNISTGELGLNLADKRLFSSNGSTTFELGSNPHSLSVGSGSFTIANGALTFPTADGTNGQVLQTNGSGTLSFADSSGGIALTDLSISTSAASGNGALSYNNSTGVFTFTPADTDVTQFAPRKLDSISTVNGQATYSMQISGSSHSPADINTLIVSLNGTIQEPGTAFTISGSNITFIPALVTDDVIDFIIDYGRGVTVGSYNDLSNLPNLDQYLQVANANFISSDQLDAYLQVANANFATTGQLDAYLQVANANFATTGQLDAYLQVANSTTFATTSQLDAYLPVANAVAKYATITNFTSTGIDDNATSTVMTLAANGNIGIGTSTIQSGFSVKKGSTAVPAAGSTDSCAQFGNSIDHKYGLQIGAIASGKGYIQVQRSDGTATTYDLLVQPNGGNVDISGDTSFGKAIQEQQYNLTGTAIDPSNGTIQYKTLTTSTTFTESLADGEFVTLMIDDGAGYTITWPTTTWVGGSAPTLETTGYNVIELWHVNGVLYGAFVGAA